MKNIILFAVLILLTLVSTEISYGFMPPSTQHNYGGARVNLGLNYGNSIRTGYQPMQHNKVGITNSPQSSSCVGTNHAATSTVIVTPPPPPPIRNTYRYRDFAGPRRYPRRSYYIPSYCMPETGFNIDIYNPFCNHYRPYGSNMYLSF